ncbi:MAG: AmmeMemoRadiSam system protein B [Desulfobacteraceae bacterium]|nr:AmmeMemoRadiSam system protein B [Desulfobacteraceae bacterium]
MTAEKIRESVIAGTWYPADAASLRREVSKYLDRAVPTAIDGELLGIIVPHAGYLYSGGVAAYAYKLLVRHPFDRVLILAPSHRASFFGSSIYNLGGYRTPLGIVALDREIIDQLYTNTPLIKYVPHADLTEHSLEIQLPFLQRVLPEFMLTPVIMGNQAFDYCTRLADAIVSACGGKRVLLVASTDLSHYYPYEEAKRLDSILLDRLQAFDTEGLAREIQSEHCQACGAGPVLTLMLAAKKLGADTVSILNYANSGDVTGERSSGVVGYMAAAIFNSKEGGVKKDKDRSEASIDLGYTSEEKEQLRGLALKAIRNRCLGEPAPQEESPSEHLSEPRGAFVCLHKEGELRGCIGRVESTRPLWETIKEMAVEAAFRDPRFCSLEEEELDKIDLEISVLTPLRLIESPSEIEIGKHGLLIRKAFHSGLLLPQVATEHGWDPTEFLQWTCAKAGLPKKAWRDPDTKIYIFSADIF